MPAANPCHAHAGSLTEAWELTEACLLEEGALRFLAQRLAVGAVAALLCVAALASLGLYAKRLRRDQREPPPLLPTHHRPTRPPVWLGQAGRRARSSGPSACCAWPSRSAQPWPWRASAACWTAAPSRKSAGGWRRCCVAIRTGEGATDHIAGGAAPLPPFPAAAAAAAQDEEHNVGAPPP